MSYVTEALVTLPMAVRAGLRDSYDWHQAVWKSFPGRDGADRDFLMRLDPRTDGFRLLIVSSVEPVRPAWFSEAEGRWRTKTIPASFFGRIRYRFQLRANPTRKISKELPDGTITKNGRRVPLTTREEFVDWLRRKGAQSGFSVEEATLRTLAQGREYFVRNGQHGLHSAVEFEGILTVTDPVRFQEAFARGIGPAKAFGFGLLVIAPIA